MISATFFANDIISVHYKFHSQDRATRIAEASDLLEKGQLDGPIFLNRIAYWKNAICTELDDFNSVNEDRVDEADEADEVLIENHTTENEDKPRFIKIMTCCVCYDKPSAVQIKKRNKITIDTLPM